MSSIAEEWTAVGSTLEAASEAGDWAEMASLLGDASESVLALAERERTLFVDLDRSLS